MFPGFSDWVDDDTVVEIALLKANWEGAPRMRWSARLCCGTWKRRECRLRVDAPDANGLCISPDGKHIVGQAGNDMRLRLRTASTLEVEREFRAHDGAISDVEWHPRLPLLVSASEDLTVRIWNVKDAHLMEELHGIATQADQRRERVALSPDGRMLAVREEEMAVWGVYELASAKPKKPEGSVMPPNPGDASQRPAASPPGK
jgi:hypothetical protein